MPPGCVRVVGQVMVAANKSSKKTSEKSNTEMFDDVPVLKRKWQAALRPGENLPRYEDVMLGSLGRLADHVVLLRNDGGTLDRLAQRPLRPAMAQRRSLGHSPERADAGLRDRARRGGIQRAAERSSVSRHRALRARRRWCGPMMCWRCRRRRAGAARWSAPTSTSATRNSTCWTRSSRRPTRAYCRWRRFATRSGSRSISRSSISTRARHGCCGNHRPICCGAGSAPEETCCAGRR